MVLTLLGVIITDTSAGAGLAAGVALLARDRKGPKPFGQALHAPMVDDRNASLSARQIDGVGIFDRKNNGNGWEAPLGDRRGTNGVNIYFAPL